ncbi:CAAX protease [Nocardia takedensis]
MEGLRLRDFLSEARHARYLTAAQGDIDRAARLFAWNCELSAAFWPSIALTEMAVRNAINARLCRALAVTEAVGWHVDALSDRPRIHLLDRDLDKLRASIEAYRRRRETTGEPTGDDVVGGTSLGLWVALCGEGIPRHGSGDYFRLIWRGKRLYEAFPHYGRWLVDSGQHKTVPADNPGPLRGMLRDFELIRNRIAHHEPIYMLAIPYHRANIAAIAGTIDPDLRRYLDHSDRVLDVRDAYRSFVLDMRQTLHG